MSLHFLQYSCGVASFSEQKPRNGFTVDVQGKICSKPPQADNEKNFFPVSSQVRTGPKKLDNIFENIVQATEGDCCL